VFPEFRTPERPYFPGMNASPEPAGGDALLLFIALAIVLVVVAEAAFVAVGGMLVMVGTVVLGLAAALAVIGATIHTINVDPDSSGTPH
jgi:hypothetical protein